MSVSPAVKTFAAVTLTVALGLGVAALMFGGGKETPPEPRRAMQPSALGAPFVLTDADGQRFDSEQLKGRVALVFFGFTHCPDVCPTTLAVMGNVLDALGPRAADVQPVFISVDPDRDTPAALQQFGSIFDPRIVKLTGTADEIAKVTAAYHVHVARVALDSGGYTIDHTASVFLFDREGRFRSTFDFHERDEVVLEKVKLALGDAG